MSSREIFNIKTWNFLQGDRQVEGILRDLPRQATLVIRNDLPNVLATVAGIRDLAATGWQEDGYSGHLQVPVNALASPRLQPDRPLDRAGFWQDFLLPHFGIARQARLIQRERELLIVLHATEANDARYPLVLPALLENLRAWGHGPVAFVLPRGEKLHPQLRAAAGKAYTSLYYDGLNAFLSSALEEAVAEFAPESLCLAGYTDTQVVYSAIGAVDYFITADAAFRNPNLLALPDLHALATRVTILASATAWQPGETLPWQEHLQTHLAQDLQVGATGPDPRFQATSESIAIDIL